MTKKTYLFISGCGRSGTSALTTLLGSHPDICLGMERYANLVSPDNFCLDKSYFEADRFSELRPDDTFYNDLQCFHKWCPNIDQKIKNSKIVGDKRPEYYMVFDKLSEAFDKPLFIHIIRNYLDVSFSWEERAKITRDWPEKRDAIASINHWNIANQKALEACKMSRSILIVDYENVFSDTIQHEVDRIMNFIGLQWNDQTREIAISNIRANAKRLSEKRLIRAQVFNEQVDVDSLKKHANLDQYNKLLQLSKE